MPINEALSNFENVREYILLLPIHEQIAEIKKMIDYYTNYKRPRTIIKQQYAQIKRYKHFKRSVIAYHLQKLRDNPLDESLKQTTPLYKLLQRLSC